MTAFREASSLPTGASSISSAAPNLSSSSRVHSFIGAFPSVSRGALRGSILLVADFLHPVDSFPVELFHYGDMRHRRGRRCAVPVLDAGRTPDHVAGSDFLFGLAPALRPAASRGDYQRLPKGMGMPGCARAGFERHQRAESAGRSGWIEQRVDPYRAGEIFDRSL
jgi:hypothetical protein